MSTYENTGTLTINGRQFAIDTYYPCGKAKPQYKIFCVWEQHAERGEKHIFAGEHGFIQWLEKVQAPVQRGLW